MSDALATTIVVAIGTISASLFTYLGIRAKVKGGARHPASPDEEQREAEEKYANNPAMFVKDILESNHQYAVEVQGLRRELAEVRAELAEVRGADRKRTTAMVRWVSRIALAWGVAVEMPYPEGEDARTLADIIPASLEASQPYSVIQQHRARQNGGAADAS